MSDTSMKKGVILLGVLPGSKAERAGLQRGDAIIALNDKPMSSMLDVVNVMENESVWKVAYMRGNTFNEVELDMTIPTVDEASIDPEFIKSML